MLRPGCRRVLACTASRPSNQVIFSGASVRALDMLHQLQEIWQDWNLSMQPRKRKLTALQTILDLNLSSRRPSHDIQLPSSIQSICKRPQSLRWQRHISDFQFLWIFTDCMSRCQEMLSHCVHFIGVSEYWAYASWVHGSAAWKSSM